jgi:RNA polymerase sigma factor (sigma-70 family)
MLLKIFRKAKPETDAEYLASYKATGNLETLGELYENHMEMVFAVCYKYLKNQEESKDAVMLIFEELILKLKSHNIGNFKSWLHTVARNHCLMALRKTKLEIHGSEYFEENIMESEPIEHLLYEPLDFDQNLNRMDECLEKLNDKQKVSVKLFYLKEKCYQQIATETGFDIKNVKSYIQNGKRNLKICIEKTNE